MGMRGPIPKRSDQRHGHRAKHEADAVTRIPASRRWIDPESGDIVYEPVPRPVVRRGARLYWVIRPHAAGSVSPAILAGVGADEEDWARQYLVPRLQAAVLLGGKRPFVVPDPPGEG